MADPKHVPGPFGRNEGWRYHPMLRVTHPKQVVPGFGTALVLFGFICVGEFLWHQAGSPKLRPSGNSVWKDSPTNLNTTSQHPHSAPASHTH